MMPDTAEVPRLNAYFCLVDFYYLFKDNDETDNLEGSIIYFYPNKDIVKKHKLQECGEIFGLTRYFKYDLFFASVHQFHFRRSFVTCQHYGRHCAYLVLSRDRFSENETQLHLNRILQLFHHVYGTWNHVLENYPENVSMRRFLRKALTPIVDYVFSVNRSIQTLFSAVRYVALKKNSQRYLLESKHFIKHVKSHYQMENGLITYERKILHSTFDTDTTYYLQKLIDLQQILPADLAHYSWKSEKKLKSGVSLLCIYLPRSSPKITPSVELTKPPADATPPDDPITTVSDSIRILNTWQSKDFSTSSIDSRSLRRYDFLSLGPQSSLDMSSDQFQNLSTEETGFDTEKTDDRTFPPLAASSSSSPQPSSTENGSNHIINARSLSPSSVGSYVNNLNNPDQRITMVRVITDEDESGFDESDAMPLPTVTHYPTAYRARSRTITNELQQNPNKTNDQIPELNDEQERESFVLYIQRNSRMCFAGVLKPAVLSDEYLRNVWLLIMSEMAKYDTEIQVLPISDEFERYSSEMKFQFYERTRLARMNMIVDPRQTHMGKPAVENVTMAFAARSKLDEHPDWKRIQFSRGDHMITVNRTVLDRPSYSCRKC